MALIEAGNLDGLVLGPVRVIDRLQAGPREAVYRVFDPRRNGEALLRCLAESEMHDAVHPDEFRQRFAAAAAVRHVHVAATYEVLEIAGRPAVLQEWLTGLPGSDWPALTSAPGVWFRLLSQAALGLRTAHDAGLVHGALEASSFVCTPEGVVKLCGLGEPRWLAAAAAGRAEPTPPATCGRWVAIAAGWAVVRRRPPRARAQEQGDARRAGRRAGPPDRPGETGLRQRGRAARRPRPRQRRGAGQRDGLGALRPRGARTGRRRRLAALRLARASVGAYPRRRGEARRAPTPAASAAAAPPCAAPPPAGPSPPDAPTAAARASRAAAAGGS